MDDFTKKVILSTIGAGTLAAGIGSVINRNRMAKKREKSLDIKKSKNTIVIDINKKGFMKDLPTPTELAKERGEIVQGQDGNVSNPSSQAVASIGPSNVSPKSEMTPEEIAAVKKNIIRNNGRKVDFFGKRASDNKKDEESESDNNKNDNKGIVSNDAVDTAVKKVESKESKETHLPPRNELGQFTSPTDPTGVVQTEKKAGLGDFFSGIRSGATSYKPLMLAGGSVASLYLSAMIVDKINEIRANRAKRDADSAREEYAKLLQYDNQEKSAQWGENIGLIANGAIVIPAVFAAMIANKVMERRKAEKDKAKLVSDSYPNDPTILYKTSDAKDIQITPDTALTLFILKQAMFEDEISEGNIKSAATRDEVGRYIGAGINALSNAGKMIEKYIDPNGGLTDAGWERLGSGQFNDRLYDVMEGYVGGNAGNASNDLGNKLKDFGVDYNRIKQDPRFLDICAKLLSDNNPRADKINQMALNKYTDEKLNRYLGNNGFGGWLKQILSWIIKNTGIGKWYYMRNLKGNLAGKLGTKYNNEAPASTTPATQTVDANTAQTTEQQPIVAVQK